MSLMTVLVAWLSAALGQNTNPLLSLVPPAPKYLTLSTSAGAPQAAGGAASVPLYVDVVPKRGMHVYAPGAKDYLPIALTITPAKNVRVGKLAYPMSEIYFFEVLNERVPVYQKPFRLTQTVTIERAAAGSPVTILGTVKYQACDDKVCYAPDTVPVSWTIK